RHPDTSQDIAGSRKKGVGRNRTGIDGFAGRCMTILPPRHREPTKTKKPRRRASGASGLELRVERVCGLAGRPWRAGYSIRLNTTEKYPERLARRGPGRAATKRAQKRLSDAA